MIGPRPLVYGAVALVALATCGAARAVDRWDAALEERDRAGQAALQAWREQTERTRRIQRAAEDSLTAARARYRSARQLAAPDIRFAPATVQAALLRCDALEATAGSYALAVVQHDLAQDSTIAKGQAVLETQEKRLHASLARRVVGAVKAGGKTTLAAVAGFLAGRASKRETSRPP